jgi:bifunctional DNase/RNase
MIEVYVARLGLDSSTNSYVVILQEKGGNRLLPIWIGQPEAESIVMQMKNMKRERPLTHDLCKRLILGLGGSLKRVEITRVQKNTYFAELHLVRGQDVVQVDARPSDSIAIALRLSAPIFAPESLLTAVAAEDAEGTEEEEPGEGSPTESLEEEERRMSAQQLKEHLESLRPEDFGKFNL